MKIPSEVKAAVGRVLLEDYMGEVRLNAALGYEVDPGLGAPEVYERPGWGVLYAPEGFGELAVEAGGGGGIWAVEGAEVGEEELEVEVVKPRDRAMRSELVNEAGERAVVDWGLGVSEGERVFVIFHRVVGEGTWGGDGATG